MNRPVDSLAPESVEPFLRGRLGKPYLYVERCETTMRLLEGPLPEGALAVTEEQTAGRGRHGHVWESPPGTSILCSLLLHPPAGRHIAELSLVTALAVAEAIEGATELACQVKWPNDVMLDRRKVAGILGEARDGTVVLGLGINVNQTRGQLPPSPRTPAASLRSIHGCEHTRAPLLGDLLWRLERLYDGWRRGGLADLYPELGARDFLRGRQVRVGDTSGVAVGIDRSGRLAIRTATGEHTLVESGDVLYER